MSTVEVLWSKDTHFWWHSVVADVFVQYIAELGRCLYNLQSWNQLLPDMFFWFLISIHDGVYTEETLTFFIENRFFSQTMHPDYSFPFFHSSQLSLIFPFPWIHSVSVSSSEWSRPPRDCNQTGQNKVQQEKAKAFHIEAGQGNPQGGKEPPKQENRVKKYTCFRCSESHKIAKLTAITKDLVQVSAGP